jgi:hypothetical protein
LAEFYPAYGDPVRFYILIATWGVCALALIAATRGRLGYQPASTTP